MALYTSYKRTFTLDDQRAFAAASHDWNPMHVDPIAARRLLSGQPVVHGIHTLLIALEHWHNEGALPPRRIECNFTSPINVDDRVSFTQRELDEHRSAVTASVDGQSCMTAVISRKESAIDTVSAPSLPPDRSTEMRPVLAEPLDRTPESQVGESFSFHGVESGLPAMFPTATRVFGTECVNTLVRASYVVGMVCPGLHSVFSSIRIEWGDATESLNPTFHVRKYDARFGQFSIAVSGAAHGEIKAFRRPLPYAQPASSDVEQHVSPGEFASVRALVIGGSRGLGELTAKLLASGGADVTITYASGEQDARRVADEINVRGIGRSRVVQFDVTADSVNELAVDSSRLTLVCFFATTRIFRRKADVFDRHKFDEFVTFYVDALHRLSVQLNADTREKPIRIFVPSTVFVHERPRGMTEYAMAKAAAEILADDLNAALKNVRIVCSRLPRMATDQTSSIMKLATESPIETMLPILRQVCGPSA